MLRIALHQQQGKPPSAIFLDMPMNWGVLILFFYSGCFIGILESSDESYGLAAFLLDLIEVISIFCLFFFGGLFDVKTIQDPDFQKMYFVLIIIIALQHVWTCIVDRDTKRLWALRLVSVFLLLFFAIVGYRCEGCNRAAVYMLMLLTVVYLFWSLSSGDAKRRIAAKWKSLRSPFDKS
jgi:hypothetical protein